MKALNIGDAVPGDGHTGNKQRRCRGKAPEPAERNAPGLADIDRISSQHDDRSQCRQQQEGNVRRVARSQSECGEHRDGDGPGENR